MEAVVTLKLTVGELDTIRAALTAYITDQHEQTKLSPTAREKQKARGEEAKASLLRQKLYA